MNPLGKPMFHGCWQRQKSTTETGRHEPVWVRDKCHMDQWPKNQMPLSLPIKKMGGQLRINWVGLKLNIKFSFRNEVTLYIHNVVKNHTHTTNDGWSVKKLDEERMWLSWEASWCCTLGLSMRTDWSLLCWQGGVMGGRFWPGPLYIGGTSQVKGRALWEKGSGLLGKSHPSPSMAFLSAHCGLVCVVFLLLFF